MTSEEFLLIRKSLGLTQQQLAKTLGVQPNTVARWERGERPILKTTELAMQYLTDSSLRLHKGYRAVLDGLRLFIEKGPDGKIVVSIYEGKHRKKVQERPESKTGHEPNLGVFQRFAVNQAYRILGLKKHPSTDEVRSVNWETY